MLRIGPGAAVARVAPSESLQAAPITFTVTYEGQGYAFLALVAERAALPRIGAPTPRSHDPSALP